MYSNYYDAPYDSFDENHVDPDPYPYKINRNAHKAYIAVSMAKVWSERRDDVDSYGQWVNMPDAEKLELFATVFDKDVGLYHAVMNQLLPNVKRRRVKLKKNLDEAKERVLIPKICSTFNLSSTKNNKNQIVLSKRFSQEEKENRKEVRQIRKILVKSAYKGTQLSIAEAQEKQRLEDEEEKSKTKEEIARQKKIKELEKILRKQATIKRQEKFDEDAYEKIVVSSEQPIASDNKGYRLLQSMGWKEGDKIGMNDNGLEEPISVRRRARNLGLGA